MKFLKSLLKFGRDENYEQAMHCYNNHLYREAIEKFKLVLNKKHSVTSLHRNLAQFYCGYAYRNLGIMLFATGNFSAALQEFHKSLKYSRSHIELYHFIGVCHNNLDDFEGAVNTFKKILDVDPSNLPTQLKLGIALHNLKMWDKSVSLYSAILEQKPGYADVHYRLGLALLGQGKPSEAIKAFQDALAINPNYIDARVKMGVTQAYMGNFDDALSNFTVITSAYPHYADVYYFLGIVHAGRNAFQEAIDSFKQALLINTAYKDARIKLGILYFHLEKFSAALQELKEASCLDPADENLKMAIDAIQGILSTPSYSDRKTSEVLNQFFGVNQPIEQTIKEFNKHLKITPDFSDIISIIKHFSQENVSLCSMLIPLVQDYIEQHPEYADLHNTLGTLHLKLNNLPEAEKSFSEAVRLNPNFLNSRINLFTTLYRLGKFEEALEQGRYLAGKNVPYPDVFCTLAEVSLELAYYDDALNYAQRMLELNSGNATAQYIMGQAYEKQNNPQKALEVFEKCLESSPSQELATKVKEALYNLTRGKSA